MSEWQTILTDQGKQWCESLMAIGQVIEGLTPAAAEKKEDGSWSDEFEIKQQTADAKQHTSLTRSMIPAATTMTQVSEVRTVG